MTYIAAWRTSQFNDPEQCGIVMSADTQETWGDFVTSVEKLSVRRTDTYELCIGGAGRSELINGFIQSVAERVRKDRPKNDDALAVTIRSALAYFYRNDVALLPGKDEDKEIQFLIGARSSTGEISLWKTEGMRLFPVNDYAVTGHETPFCQYVMGRVYEPTIPLDNAVVLSVWLVSIAKATSAYAGGPTGIVVLSRDGIYSKTPDELKALEVGTNGHDEVFALTMALTSDVLAKQMGSKAPPALVGLTDGKIRLSYPAAQPLPPGFVNTFDFESYRTLVSIRAFVTSASGSIRSGKIIPSPTTKALLNETISELNTVMPEALEWHNSAVEAQAIGVILPDSKALEQSVEQVKAGFFIYLAYVLKEIVREAMPSILRTLEGQR
jgi:hypothetical protein